MTSLTDETRTKNVGAAGAAAAALAALIAMGVPQPQDPQLMGDFAIYWGAARLWWLGGDPSVSAALEAYAPTELAGPWVYPTWVLLALQLFAFEPYGTAAQLWWWTSWGAIALGHACWGWLATRAFGWRGALAAAAAALLASELLRAPLRTGHISGFEGCLIGLGILLVHERRETFASAILTMAGGIRLTELALVPSAWVSRPRPAPFIASVAVLGALIVFQWAQPQAYWHAVVFGVSDDLGVQRNPTLIELARHFDVSPYITVLAAVTIVSATAWAAARSQNAPHRSLLVMAGVLLLIPRRPLYAWSPMVGLLAVGMARGPRGFALMISAAALVGIRPVGWPYLLTLALWLSFLLPLPGSDIPAQARRTCHSID